MKLIVANFSRINQRFIHLLEPECNDECSPENQTNSVKENIPEPIIQILKSVADLHHCNTNMKVTLEKIFFFSKMVVAPTKIAPRLLGY